MSPGSNLAVRSGLPTPAPTRPPIILIHGAANSSRVWTFWQCALAHRGWASHAIDLRGHGQSSHLDLSTTSMYDYTSDIRSLAGELANKPILMGWSMGGLVAMMVAATGDATACVALAPSMPAQRTDESITLRTGEFGPEEYGIVSIDPEDQPGMADHELDERRIALASLSQESRLARDQRGAGIVVQSLPCPFLLVTGTEDRAWPLKRYRSLWLGADQHQVQGASHWGLVLNRRALSGAIPAVAQWLSANYQAGQHAP